MLNLVPVLLLLVGGVCLSLSAILFARQNLIKPPYHNPNFELREGQFKRLATVRSTRPIVMVGDSITQGAEWAELTGRGDVLNRGIGGDTSRGVLNRLDSILALNPSKVFLLIGTNDAMAGIKPDESIANIQAICKRLSSVSKTYLLMLFPSASRRKNVQINAINAGLETVAHNTGATLIDLRPVLTDSSGLLQPALTSDGLHLSAKAYDIWLQAMEPYMQLERYSYVGR